MIAEDDDAVRDLVLRTLNEDGHDLTVAPHGVAAIEAMYGCRRLVNGMIRSP